MNQPCDGKSQVTVPIISAILTLGIIPLVKLIIKAARRRRLEREHISKSKEISHENQN